jgi:hypothetical protein
MLELLWKKDGRDCSVFYYAFRSAHPSGLGSSRCITDEALRMKSNEISGTAAAVRTRKKKRRASLSAFPCCSCFSYCVFFGSSALGSDVEPEALPDVDGVDAPAAAPPEEDFSEDFSGVEPPAAALPEEDFSGVEPPAAALPDVDELAGDSDFAAGVSDLELAAGADAPPAAEPPSTPSADRVFASILPVASMPLAFWKSFNAACVFGPICPSTGPASWPAALSFSCTCFTLSALCMPPPPAAACLPLLALSDFALFDSVEPLALFASVEPLAEPLAAGAGVDVDPLAEPLAAGADVEPLAEPLAFESLAAGAGVDVEPLAEPLAFESLAAGAGVCAWVDSSLGLSCAIAPNENSAATATAIGVSFMPAPLLGLTRDTP